MILKMESKKGRIANGNRSVKIQSTQTKEMIFIMAKDRKKNGMILYEVLKIMLCCGPFA